MGWRKRPESEKIKRIKKSEMIGIHVTDANISSEVEERQKKNFSPGVEKVERITTQDLDSDLKRKVKK